MKLHLLLPLFFTMISSAWATSFYIRPFSEFTQQAALIIRGKPTHIHVENGIVPEGKTIYTFATLEIQEILKGNISGSQITIRKLGGTKDGVTLEIPSSVDFVENEDGVFFLSAEKEDHSYEVTGMELGKFTLERKNGEEILTGGLLAYSKGGLNEKSHDHGNSVVNSGNITENLKPWSLTQLRELIRSQGDTPPHSTPTVQKTPEISNPLPEASVTMSPAASITPSITTPQEKTNSPLYFEAGFWYAVATLILMLGVFFYLRRG